MIKVIIESVLVFLTSVFLLGFVKQLAWYVTHDEDGNLWAGWATAIALCLFYFVYNM